MTFLLPCEVRVWVYNLIITLNVFLYFLGISYQFFSTSLGKESEIYVSLDSGEVHKLRVAVKIDIDNIELTPINNDTMIYTNGGKQPLGRISVDWVNGFLYWVELGNGSCTIRRQSLDGGEPEQVGMAEKGEITDIFLDPIHGYACHLLHLKCIEHFPTHVVPICVDLHLLLLLVWCSIQLLLLAGVELSLISCFHVRHLGSKFYHYYQ